MLGLVEKAKRGTDMHEKRKAIRQKRQRKLGEIEDVLSKLRIRIWSALDILKFDSGSVFTLNHEGLSVEIKENGRPIPLIGGSDVRYNTYALVVNSERGTEFVVEAVSIEDLGFKIHFDSSMNGGALMRGAELFSPAYDNSGSTRCIQDSGTLFTRVLQILAPSCTPESVERVQETLIEDNETT